MTKILHSGMIRKACLQGICVCLILFAHTAWADMTIKTKDVSCYGKRDGEVTIKVPVVGSFLYSIDGENFQVSSTFTGLDAGMYTATVRDNDSKCEFSKDFEILEPDPLSLSVGGSGTFPYCAEEGPPTIRLTAYASGGTPPLEVSPPELYVSASGTYGFTVTDKNGCTVEAFATVVMVPILCSYDPNDIIGPVGVGPEKWVAQSAVQPYTIRFENDPELATAPAQVVRITQKLDPDLNIFSFRLGDFGFGSFTFSIPENRTYYTTRLNVGDSLGILVDVTAGIDVTKGEAFWLFKSIDPATGLAPAADRGLLLVNDSLHRGEGFVSYTIQAKSSAATYDSIHALASIVFDVNEPILTPEISNTIDATAPESAVNPVPAEIASEYTFAITGSDVGSGLEAYDLFISENNGNFTALATRIPIDSGYTFYGKEGFQYRLYSIGIDRVGNREAIPASPDVSFSVKHRPFVRLSASLGSEEYCAGDTLTIPWQSAGIEAVDLYYTSDNGAGYTPIATGIEANVESYSWISPSTLTAGKQYQLLIRASEDTTLYHTQEGTLTINRAKVPVIASSLGQTLCAEDSTTLTVKPAFKTYHWSTGGVASAITVADGGTYNVTVTDYDGCTASGSVQLTEHPAIGQPSITITGKTTFCAGDSVILSAPDGFTSYHWSTGAASQRIKITQSGSYHVQVKNNTACSSPVSESVTVVVNALPEAPVVTAEGPLTFCEGGSVVLSVPEGFAGYQWSTGDTTRTLTVSETGSYKVRLTDAAGCTSQPSLNTSVFVRSAPPKPIIEANGPLSFCAGGSVTLSAPAGLGGYHWSTGETTQTITVSTTGSYTVTATSADGCASVASDPTNVQVSDTLPKPVIEASGPLSFCAGGSVVLSAPAGFTGYVWSTGQTTQSITVSVSGDYSVSVNMNNSCTSPSSDAVTVHVSETLPKPVIQVSGPLSFCEGGSVTLSAPAGVDGYAWSTGETTQSITVSATGSYAVTMSMTTGCTSPVSDAVSVQVLQALPKPIVEASGPVSFCAGGSVTLSAPSGFDHYVWSTGDTTRTITASVTGSYSVTVSMNNGCTSPVSDAVSVQVLDALPKPVVEANGPLFFCTGGSVTLSAPSGFDHYLWSTGATTQNITVSTTGNYSVAVTMNNGCASPASDAVAVQVLETLPKPVVEASGPLSFCAGGSVTLSAPAGLAGYLWSSGQTTRTITVSTSGQFSVKITSGCGSPSSDAVTVAVHPLPPKPVIIVNGSTTICDGGSVVLEAPTGFTAYQWSTGATTRKITVTTSGTFTVQVTNNQGCKVTSDPVTIRKEASFTVHAGDNTIIYAGYSAPCVTLTATVRGATGHLRYRWSNGATTKRITVCPGTTTTYTVTVTDQKGCSASDQVKVCVVDVRCATNKVKVCHTPRRGRQKTLCLPVHTARELINCKPNEYAIGSCHTLPSCIDTSGSAIARESESITLESNMDLDVHPNPFREKASIEFSMPRATRVSVKVYNAVQQEVATVFDDEVVPGITYQFDFEPGNANSGGVFYCTLTDLGTGRVYVRKVLWVR
jgi:hypothetical protein